MNGIRDSKSKALSGVRWTVIEQMLSLSLTFVIGIIIARLVSPSDYGLIAMLSIFMAIGNVFANSGINTALVRKKTNTIEDYSTAFYINLALGFVIYIFFYFTAPLVAKFYNIPLLDEVFRLYSLNILITSLSIVQIAKLTHELRLKKQALIKIISILVSGAIGVFMASKGYGVWALVWFGLSKSIVSTVLFWILSGWMPILAFSGKTCHYLYSFGSKMIITNVIDVVYDNIYSLLIGKCYTPACVGFYNRSLQISQLPQNLLGQVVSKVILPVLTPLQDDDYNLVRAYDKIFRITVFLVYPLMTLIAVLANPIITFLLGEKWLPSAPYLQILSVGVVFVALTLVNLNLFFVKGRADIILKTDILKKSIGFVIVAVTVPLGMKWICFGTILYALSAFTINSRQTYKLLGYGLKPQIKTAAPSLFYSALMGVSVYICIQHIEIVTLQLIIGSILGGGVYILIASLFKEPALREVADIVRHRNGK